MLHYIDFFQVPTLAYCAGEAESGLERLHQCAEKELQVYLNVEGQSKDFNLFRTKLAGLTRLLSNKTLLSFFFSRCFHFTGSEGPVSFRITQILILFCVEAIGIR